MRFRCVFRQVFRGFYTAFSDYKMLRQFLGFAISKCFSSSWGVCLACQSTRSPPNLCCKCQGLVLAGNEMPSCHPIQAMMSAPPPLIVGGSIDESQLCGIPIRDEMPVHEMPLFSSAVYSYVDTMTTSRGVSTASFMAYGQVPVWMPPLARAYPCTVSEPRKLLE